MDVIKGVCGEGRSSRPSVRWQFWRSRALWFFLSARDNLALGAHLKGSFELKIFCSANIIIDLIHYLYLLNASKLRHFRALESKIVRKEIIINI